MMRGLLLVALVAVLVSLAGCTPPGGDNPAPQPTTTAASPSPVGREPADQTGGTDLSDALNSLKGEWRVASIDGAEFDEPYGLALSADDSRIWFEPACAAQGRNYTISGLRFAAAAPGTSSDQVVCDIAVPDGLAEVWRAIDAAERVERTPGNGVMISGGGRSLLLFAQ